MDDEQINDAIQTVKTSKLIPMVVLIDLKPEHQQQIWKGIKQTAPELAGILEDDEVFKELKASFDAKLVMNRADAEKYYRAGEK